MAFITVGSGGSDIPAGVYPVTLTGIEGPKTITPRSGPNAGQDVDIYSWNFVVDEGEWENEEIEATTSTASGPRSKMYAFLTALFGGQAPPPRTSLEISDLTGRRALATIELVDGWPRIVNLGAMPQAMLSQRFAAATGAPAQQPAAAATQAPAAPARGRGGRSAAAPATQQAPAAAPASQPLRGQVTADNGADLPW
jgi:hypothetical protein